MRAWPLFSAPFFWPLFSFLRKVWAKAALFDELDASLFKNSSPAPLFTLFQSMDAVDVQLTKPLL